MPDTDRTAIGSLISAVHEGILYHYTSQQGLLGIVQNKVLWMSNIRYLSDAAEFGYAAGLVREVLNQSLRTERGPWNDYYAGILDTLDETLHSAPSVASFSEEGDLLSQWRAYTPNGLGFSVGFTYDCLKQLAKSQLCSIMRCSYEKSEHDAIVRELIGNAGKWIVDSDHDESVQTAVSVFFGSFLWIAPALKHPSFHEEREWRLVRPAQPLSVDKPKFKPGKSMLVPYFEFSLADKGRFSPSRIFVGPTPHMQLSVESTTALLQANEVISCETVSSGVPYRSW
jgi:hypothetical protein